jgi:hypothetical protein
VYAKAVEHISDWDGMFASLAGVVRPEAIVYFKHRTFYSYLGAHRRGSIGIPWGHLLLTDAEYRRCVDEFYPEDAERMKAFYFEDLTYPRQSVSEMIVQAQRHGFYPLAVISEPARYIDQIMTFINDVDNFWAMVARNHPGYEAVEVMAGMVHILLRKHPT